jgi:hypothetical protein
MSWSYLTLEEAQPLMGKRVRTRQPYFTVPVGSTGTVVRLDDRYGDYGDYGLVVRWDNPVGSGERYEIAFTPAQFKWAVEEID